MNKFKRFKTINKINFMKISKSQYAYLTLSLK